MSDISAWALFPYPTAHIDGTHSPGSLFDWPAPCMKCVARPCEKSDSKIGQVAECRFGLHYVRANDQTLLAGLVVADIPTLSKQARRRRRTIENHVKLADLRTALQRIAHIDESIDAEFQNARNVRLHKELESGSALHEITDSIREDLAKSLNQSHDFLLLAKQMKGYAVALLDSRFPGEPPEVAADKLPSEGAIFFTTQLLLGKIDATLYLEEPNRVFGSDSVFELHKFITKYFRIYRFQATQKDVDLKTNGSCRANVHYNSDAIGVVIHALLDNLVKYAPAASKADILFKEGPDTVEVEFISLGPKIRPDEMQKIFMPGYRSEGAKNSGLTGLGLGLGAAMTVADMLDLNLGCRQSEAPDARFPLHHETTFSLTFETYLEERMSRPNGR